MEFVIWKSEYHNVVRLLAFIRFRGAPDTSSSVTYPVGFQENVRSRIRSDFWRNPAGQTLTNNRIICKMNCLKRPNFSGIAMDLLKITLLGSEKQPKLIQKWPNDNVGTLFFNLLNRFRLLYRTCGSGWLMLSLLKLGQCYSTLQRIWWGLYKSGPFSGKKLSTVRVGRVPFVKSANWKLATVRHIFLWKKPTKKKQAGTGPSRRHIQGSKIAKRLPSVKYSFTVVENRNIFEVFFWKNYIKKWTDWRANVSQCRKKLKGGTLWDFPTSILSQNIKKMQGGPFEEKKFRKKIRKKMSRSAEKNWKGGVFGLARYDMLRGKTGKTILVQFARPNGAIWHHNIL